MVHFATPLEYVILINLLISWVHLFTESYLYDTENIVPFENTTPINLLNLPALHSFILTYYFDYRVIRVVFSNGIMVSVSHKYDSVNECNQEISKLINITYSMGEAKCPLNH